MSREQEIQRELIRRRQLKEQQEKQNKINAGIGAVDFLYKNRKDIPRVANTGKEVISGMIDKFTGKNNYGSIMPEAVKNLSTFKTPTSNTTLNAPNVNTPSFGANLATGAGGAIGGAVGSYGGEKLSDAIGVDGVGKEAIKTAGSIGGSMAGTAAANAGLSALASGATSAGTAAATGAAAGAGSTLAASAAGGPIGLAIGALIAAAQWGLGKLKEKKAKQKQNRAMSKAYSEQGAEEMQQAADKIKAETSQTGQILNNALNHQQPEIPTDLAGYQYYLINNGYSEEAINGVLQGLNNGDKSVSNWIDTYNQNNPDSAINIPQTEEEIALARAGKFNQAEDEGILAKVGDIMSQIKSGYTDNRGSSFTLENLAPDENKTGWNRVGEALGTGARIASNPYVQGVVAGTLHGIDKGDALYGFNQGWNHAQNKAKSDKYYEAITGGKDAPIMATYDADDYKTHVKKVNDQREYDRKVYNDEVARLNKDEDQKVTQQKHEEAVRHNKAMEGLSSQRNDIMKNRDNEKIEQQELYNADLAEFTDIFNNGDQGQIEYARKMFMQTHGKDPFRYIKLASDWEEQVGY